MRFTRKSTKALSSANISFSDYILYIRRIVDIFSAAYISDRLRLTPKERDSFIATVVVKNLDLETSSPEAEEIYKDLGFRVEKGEIKSYLRKLEEKLWVKRSSTDYDIPNDFLNISEEEDMYDFNIRLILDGRDS